MRLGRAAALLALGGALAAAPGIARADAGGGAAAAEGYARAEQAWQARRFAEALAGYREALAADPSARFAPVARARAAELEAHAEGGFAPLARLEEVRRDPQKLGDRAAIEALGRDLAGFPAGRVRAEAELLVAEAWWHRLGEPRRAIASLEAVVADEASDRVTRGLALAELAAVRRELGELDAARALVDRFPDLSPGTRAEVLRLTLRARLEAISAGLLGLLLLIGLGSLLRAARRPGGVRAVPPAVVRPLAVGFALYLGGAAAILARLRGDGDPRPFLWLGLGVLAIDVIARTWRLGSGPGGAGARAARGLACAAGVVAVAFLALERTDAAYLENLGL